MLQFTINHIPLILGIWIIGALLCGLIGYKIAQSLAPKEPLNLMDSFVLTILSTLSWVAIIACLIVFIYLKSKELWQIRTTSK